METEANAEREINKNESIPDLMQIIELVKMLADGRGEGDATASANQSPPQQSGTTAFDEISTTPKLKLLKASIPYLEPEHQKTIGIAIKIAEIQKLLQALDAQSNSANVQAASAASNRNNMLVAIRPYLETDKQYLADMLIKLDEIKSILGLMQTVGQFGDAVK